MCFYSASLTCSAQEFDTPVVPTPQITPTTVTILATSTPKAPASPTPKPVRVKVSAAAVAPGDYTSACAALTEDISQLDALHREFQMVLLVYQQGDLMSATDENGQVWNGDESFLPEISRPQYLIGGVREKGFAISSTYQGEPFVEQPFVLVRPFIGNSTSQAAEVVKKVFNVFNGKECLVHYTNARAQLLDIERSVVKKKKKKKR